MNPRLLPLLLVLPLIVLGCGSPLVGAECAAGHTDCDGACVDLEADPDNCGGCGIACDGTLSCVDAVCGGPNGDAGPGDGDAGPGDGGPGDGDGDGDRPFTDGGPMSTGVGKVLDPKPDLPGTNCRLGELRCGDLCVEPDGDPEHCGTCDNVCPPTEYCSNGICDIDCAPGLIKCGPRICRDPNSPRHCGACNNRCASGICRDGMCRDALPGHIVVLGHDYTESNGFKDTLLGNAIFLGQGNPVRTLVYRGEASAASVAGVEQAIARAESTTGRMATQLDAVPSKVSELLEDEADVFLIHAQAGASDAELAALMSLWGQAMVDFVYRGGVIVLLDAPSDSNTGTYQLLVPPELFLPDSAADVDSGEDLTVATPGQGIAWSVGTQYRAGRNSVSYSGVISGGEAVSFAADGSLVVIDRTVIP